jgi:hypothetical protein
MNFRHAAALAIMGWYLMALAAGCFVVVVLTHVCERFGLFPSMGWGLRHSTGHYLDLSAAVLSILLFPTGYLLRARSAARN